MLVLTRKPSESLIIGDDIEVTVLSVMGDKVRIGIQAPREIPVYRKEIYLEIAQEQGSSGISCGGRRRAQAPRRPLVTFGPFGDAPADASVPCTSATPRGCSSGSTSSTDYAAINSNPQAT